LPRGISFPDCVSWPCWLRLPLWTVNSRPTYDPIGGVRLGMSIGRDDGWSLDVVCKGLFGGLAYQLMLAVVGEEGLYICDGCHAPYIRTVKAPKPGQNNFCPDCKDIVPKRNAVKKWRENEKRRKLAPRNPATP
jgi:hypothetical protein